MRKVVAEATDRLSPALKPLGRTRPGGPAVQAVRRGDLVPSMVPFPKARYVFMVNAFPRIYGGRTGSILTKTRLLNELAEVDSEIVLVKQKADLDELTRLLRDRGALVEGVTLRKLQEYDAGEAATSGQIPGGTDAGQLRRLHTAAGQPRRR